MNFFGLVNSYDNSCRRTKYFQDEDFSESEPMQELPGNLILFRIYFKTHKHVGILERSVYLLKFFCSFEKLSCFVKPPSAPSTSANDFRLLQVPSLKVLRSLNGYKVQFDLSASSLTTKDLPITQKSSFTCPTNESTIKNQGCYLRDSRKFGC